MSVIPGFLLIAAGMGVIEAARETSRGGFAFFGIAVLLPGLAMMTMFVEKRRVRALAFFELLPQRARPFQLVLWPMRFFALVGAIILALAGHLPPLSVAVFAGAFWWSISVGHWCAGRGGWGVVFALVLVWLDGSCVWAVVVGNPTIEIGLRAGAAFAMTLALFALLVPSRRKLGRLLANPSPASLASPASPAERAAPASRARAQVRVQREALEALAASRSNRWTNHRLHQLMVSTNLEWRWTLSFWIFFVPFVGLSMIGLAMIVRDQGGASWTWMIMATTASTWVTRSTERAKVEFFVTRPLSRIRIFVVTVLPWILLALAGPVEDLLLTRFERAGRAFLFVRRSERGRMERILGISPHDWVQTSHGTGLVMTNDLLGKFYRDGLRAGLISLMWLTAGPLFANSVRATQLSRWAAWGLYAAAWASAAPYFLAMFGGSGWPPPPLWLAAVIAGLGAALLFRQRYCPAVR